MSNGDKTGTLTEDWSEKAKADKLYVAIRANDTAEIERLRAEGVTLSDYIKSMLKFGGGGYENYKRYGKDWYNFNFNHSKYPPKEFISVIRNLYAELGKPIYNMEDVNSSVPGFYRADVFACVLDCVDNRVIPKEQTLQYIIDNNLVGLLEIAADHGWFKLAKTCDEYIEYAHEKNRAECAAWLVDYKNRTFDLARERKKAERRQIVELNAAPDSVMALKAFWSFRKLKDGTYAVTEYKGTQTEITVPGKIGGAVVTAIKPYDLPLYEFVPYEMRDSITKITLPQGLITIGDGAFYFLGSLTEINIPDGVVSIGRLAFNCCTKLERLELPDSVTEIGKLAFCACTKLREINIPRGVTEIKKGIFNGCISIEKLEIPDTVGKISQNAFHWCNSLERIELPGSVERIGKNAFRRCSSLKEIVIPEGVREIGETAFEDCESLERAELPVSLKKAKNLTKDGEPTKTIFNNCPKLTAVVTPRSYAERYCKRNNIPFVYKDN